MAHSSQRKRITQYIQDTYGTQAEYLWADSPGNAIFRHPASKKWYAALMCVLPKKLGLTGEEALDVIDIKCSTIMIGSLLATKGFLPAYHMNKNHWISIVLDNSVPDDQIIPLLELSYDSWAPAVLIGGLLPVMVMFGLHHGVAPLGSMQMASLGYDSIFGPGCVCSNIAQGVAALVVAVRTKDSKTKQTGYSSGVTALMGITEPVLYGLNLPKKYPLAGAMIGGGLGGLYAGITHTHRFATGSSGIPAVLLYIGDDTMTYFYNIIIALLISAATTAVVTFLLSLKFEKAEPAAEEEAKAAPAFDFEVPANTVAAPVEGTVVPMEEIPDETFSAGVLGQGLGIQPVNGEIAAPFSGTVTQVADTGHAIGLASRDGLELLIHVGVDTVEMNGTGFTPKVKEGDTVQAGQLLLTFDRKAIAAAEHPDVVVVMLTNADDYGKVTCAPAGEVKPGAQIIHAEN